MACKGRRRNGDLVHAVLDLDPKGSYQIPVDWRAPRVTKSKGLADLTGPQSVTNILRDDLRCFATIEIVLAMVTAVALRDGTVDLVRRRGLGCLDVEDASANRVHSVQADQNYHKHWVDRLASNGEDCNAVRMVRIGR